MIIDDPPTWLKQTDLYKEYTNKSQQINTENLSSESSLHFHQQVHRKQRCNLQMYAKSSQSWQSLPSPLVSPINDHRSKSRNHSNESLHKIKISPIHTSSPTSMMDFSTPLNISIKQETIEQNSIKTKSSKQQITRRKHMLCKKKLPQNGGLRRRQRMNSVENQGKNLIKI